MATLSREDEISNPRFYSYKTETTCAMPNCKQIIDNLKGLTRDISLKTKLFV